MKAKECRVLDMIKALEDGATAVTIFVGKQEFFLQNMKDMVVTYFMFLEYEAQKIKEGLYIALTPSNQKNEVIDIDKRYAVEDKTWFVDKIDNYNLNNVDNRVHISLRRIDHKGVVRIYACNYEENKTILEKFLFIENYICKALGGIELKYKVHKPYLFELQAPFLDEVEYDL